MFSQNAFLRIEAPIPSNERLKSAIVNCISPDCGGSFVSGCKPVSISSRCGTDGGQSGFASANGPAAIRSSVEAGRLEMQLPIECL